MPDVIPDFWPANIGETQISTPLSLMKAEASYLGPKTRQLVKAEIVTASVPDGRLVQSFVLVVPGLNNYKYQLFNVVHTITPLYPVYVNVEGASSTAQDQSALIAKIKEIVGSGRTKAIVEALLAQVSGQDSEADYRIESGGTTIVLTSERAAQRGTGPHPAVGATLAFRTRPDVAQFVQNSEIEGYTFVGKEFLS